MDAGTVRLFLYLAGLGLPSWNLGYPLNGLFEAYPEMQLVHTRVPVHHPLVFPMRSKEACLHVAERERTRGNKAYCETLGVNFLRAEDTGDLQVATEFYMIVVNWQHCYAADPRGEGQRLMIGGFPTDLARCKTTTRVDGHGDRHTSVCIRAPVWVVDKRHWRLVGNTIVYKTSAKAP